MSIKKQYTPGPWEVVCLKEAAQKLGVSIPRVSKALIRLQIPTFGFRNSRLFEPKHLATIQAAFEEGIIHPGRPKKAASPVLGGDTARPKGGRNQRPALETR